MVWPMSESVPNILQHILGWAPTQVNEEGLFPPSQFAGEELQVKFSGDFL